MTKTTPNRITISIMNLWVKRIGQLAVLAVALFFLACEDDTSLLGFKNPNSKFDIRYVEIPIPSSILLLDSVRTSNFSFSGESNKLLVGQYTDEQLGVIRSEAYAQFLTSSGTKLAANAAFDSVTLQLAYDAELYTYGSATPTTHQVNVYELDEELNKEIRNYYNSTEVAVKPTPLGSKDFSVNPEIFKEFIEDDEDTTLLINLRLANEFGERLFQSAIRYRDATTEADSSFVMPSEFVKEFKGIAIKPGESDALMVAFSTGNASRIILHYHTDTADSLQLALTFNYFNALKSFHKITADRSSTPLAGLTPYQPLEEGDLRYIQSGTGLVTKINLDKILEFADTVPNVIINSAELIISDLGEPTRTPPTYLGLRVLKDNNRFKAYSQTSEHDRLVNVFYKSYLTPDIETSSQTRTVLVDNDSVLYVRHDRTLDGHLMAYNSTNKSYSGSIGGFLQQLLNTEDGKTQYLNFALYPVTPEASKSVNRVVFNKDNIRLRINYTKPTINQN